jgi:hypothetical protein
MSFSSLALLFSNCFALNLRRSAIPKFTSLVGPMHDLLVDIYQRAAGKHTKTAVTKICLSEVGCVDNVTEGDGIDMFRCHYN